MSDRPLVLCVARVQRRGRLEQQDVRFLLVGDGPVFDPTGDDQELALFQPDVPIPKLHAKPASDDQEEFVFVVVVVPQEWPWNLTNFTCWPFNSPTIFGLHWSLNCASFSLRLTLSMIGSDFLVRLVHPAHEDRIATT
ncbi:MAG TPA: hypothetical protein VN688_27560 [Gemmataceae bacterium]|nr:hypothetical protein [Gemmataceae bacterium]